MSGAVFSGSQALGAAPRPIQWLGYGAIATFMKLLYFVPGMPMRKSARAFVEATNTDKPWRIYSGLINGFVRFARRMEQLNQGDVLETTQAWADTLEVFYRRFPGEWINMYDKRWSSVLEASAEQARCQDSAAN
jgi:hypothetical protein